MPTTLNMKATDPMPSHANAGSFTKGADSRRFGGGRSPTPRIVGPNGVKMTLAELAREATLDSVRVLHECVNDVSEEMHVRCRAAGYLLSLGWGAAPKQVDLHLVTNKSAANMGENELLELAMSLTAPQMPPERHGDVLEAEIVPPTPAEIAP